MQGLLFKFAEFVLEQKAVTKFMLLSHICNIYYFARLHKTLPLIFTVAFINSLKAIWCTMVVSSGSGMLFTSLKVVINLVQQRSIQYYRQGFPFKQSVSSHSIGRKTSQYGQLLCGVNYSKKICATYNNVTSQYYCTQFVYKDTKIQQKECSVLFTHKKNFLVENTYYPLNVILSLNRQSIIPGI